ncbi:MAG: hypothetical protein E6J91_19940 [Deltaproteobacteria bacterium]|nr:MAG: hypothetical protein E6J91_19940 [Deltaproteobacteria bacterium]
MTDSSATQRARIVPPRDERGRFVARPGATPRPARVSPPRSRDASGRVRSLPSRDARGRFVAFSTTSAPSWYVFCADGYRIPGNDEVHAKAIDARLAPQSQPLPPARVMRRRRLAMQWDEIATWLLIATFVVVVGWHMLHLQLPNR